MPVDNDVTFELRDDGVLVARRGDGFTREFSGSERIDAEKLFDDICAAWKVFLDDEDDASSK